MASSEPRPRLILADIAREAGVSTATASKVVNGRSDVAPGTRRRVQELLERHGYSSPTIARPVRRGGLIDVVFNGLDSPWAVEILRGIEEACSGPGTGVVVARARTGGDVRPSSWPAGAMAHQSLGVIVVTSAVSEGDRKQLQKAGIPLVVVDPANYNVADAPSISATNWTGGLDSTDHLTALGHRRIAAIGGRPSLLCSMARVDGYRAALDRAGIPRDETLVRWGNFDHESGFREASELLDLPDPPTAIFAGSDQQAFGVVQAARVRGLRVPEDLSVVGFDDLPMSRWAAPPLTTVRQPLFEMGRLAAETLLSINDGRPPRSHRIELATELIVRESTAPPRA